MEKANRHKIYNCKTWAKVMYFCALFTFLVSMFSVNRFECLEKNGLIISFVFLILGSVFCFFDRTILPSIYLESSIVYFVMLAFWTLTWRTTLMTRIHYDYRVALAGTIAFCTCFAFCASRTITSGILNPRKFLNYICNNVGIVVVILIFALCYLEVFQYLFKCDSYIYYSSIPKNEGKWRFTLETISVFQLGYHLSYGYSILAFIGYYLFPIDGKGVKITNLIIFIITIYVVYELIKILFPKRKQIFHVLLTAMFAFNPLIIGIAQEMNLDMPALCFFLWLIWSHINQKKVFCFIFSCMTCFSKETGVVFIVGYALGLIIYRVNQIGLKHAIKERKKIIKAYEWYIIYGPLLFVEVYLFGGTRWGAGQTLKGVGIINTFQVNWQYILIKIQEMFVFNFQWIIVILAILFIVVHHKKKRKIKLSEVSCGFLVAYIVELAFQLLYFTYPHYRYLQYNAIFFAFAIGYILEYCIEKEKIQNYIIVGITILFGIQSFYSIDILSTKLFRQVETGNGTISSLAYFVPLNNGPVYGTELDGADLSNEKYRDYVQNNREYLRFEDCFEDFLSDIDYQKGDAIVISPNFSNSYWGKHVWTMVNMFGVFDIWSLYWNIEEQRLTYDKTQTRIRWLTARQSKYSIEKIENIWFVELDFESQYDVDKYLSYFKVVDKRTYSNSKWSINAYKLKAKKAKKK